MSANSFSGDAGLPTTIGRWAECDTLVMRFSGIGGTLPTEIGNMAKLETLDLAMNKAPDVGDGITGTIPTEIGLLTKLENLVLFENSMQGKWCGDVSVVSLLESLWCKAQF
jgi:hypothetical protein